MKQQSEHLSSAQIENYGNRTSGAELDVDHEAEQVEAHLEDCPSCRSRLLDFQRNQFGLVASSNSEVSKNADLETADSNTTDGRLGGQFTDVKSKNSESVAANLADHKFTDLNLANSVPTDTKQAAPKPANAKFVPEQQTGFGQQPDPKHRTDRPVNTASTPDCSSPDALRQLAAGLLTGADAETLSRHAATCDHCGPLLRAYTEDFSADFSPQEQAVLAKLQSSSAEWQRKTAREMIRAATAGSEPVISANPVTASPVISANNDAGFAKENAATARKNPIAGENAVGAKENPSPASEDAGTMSANVGAATSLPQESFSNPRRKPVFWKWALIPAATAACAAIAFGIWYTQRDTPEKVEKLLAQAAMEVRTMDTRWPGASYSTVKSNRGASDPANLPLLEAQQIVDRHPGQKQWLLEDASVALLQRRPDTAIQMLSLATVEPTCDRCTLVLAIAEIAEGDSTGFGKNYQAALTHINSISSNSSEYNVALYNRAVVNERLGKIDDAIADWRTVLKTERDNGWVSEAHEKLADLVARPAK